ncbi:hypothetical protein [Kitasatospora cathayae]|uniref:Uncharacterized protein n=1 Tax=Kitasatospora cathayae TaxID=3004092 RepID=A0ABY7QJJ0_9ACTN|nr:hypothetical protein [Kitasatospora sp. HUAS 3-15]WBP92031.1 hypothetical protein O1G21_40305 [Kitasatospora sp. HUAS 3-15]
MNIVPRTLASCLRQAPAALPGRAEPATERPQAFSRRSGVPDPAVAA